ncbi:Cytochrome P450 protein [Rutstroemia sp. NJR-2017a BVV2]|nr:Cytochrome P450 protein [Rutstroemia sp. NJR-2017a BVV2]
MDRAGAFEAMDGPSSNTTRSDWYDLLFPRVSSLFTRDKKQHDERRRIWSHSLSARALSSYEPRVLRKVHGLKEHISKAHGKLIFVNDLMQWFSFDLMGAFAFSEDWGMMEKSEYHVAISMVRSAITLLGPFSPAIWIPRLGFALIPHLWKVKDWFGMLAFCDTCMERRMKRKVKEKDIASWFIEDAEKNKDNDRNKLDTTFLISVR